MKLQSEREICGDLILMLMVSLKCGLWSFKKNVLVVQKAKNKDYVQFGSSVWTKTNLGLTVMVAALSVSTSEKHERRYILCRYIFHRISGN